MKVTCGKISRPCKLFVGVAFALCCAAVQAQPQQPRGPVGRPPPRPAPHGPQRMVVPHGPPPNQPHGPPSGQAQGGPSGQSVRDRWLAMPPDARQNFQRNAQLWMQMSPEQRNLMRQRENMRRQMITRDAAAAVRDSGLQLNPQDRARFESRYVQERRKVEQTLRQQIDSERQKEIPALIQQLRKEFQLEPGKSAGKPAASPKSGR